MVGCASSPRREVQGHTPMKNDHGKSDPSVVPEKLPNKADNHAAEVVEERDWAKGNSAKRDKPWTLSQTGLPSALERVGQAARQEKKTQFTALMHHIYNVDRLREAYRAISHDAAAGIDGETWKHYGERLEENLQDLSGRLARGAYRARPVRRVYIEKADGRKRPLGVPALEDKIVQRSAVEVLNAIYEADFLGFSYGFRPGRSQHHALDALWVGLMRKKVSWVLDADIRAFFDTMDHGWMMRFLEHRIGDRRIHRLMRKWLTAGVSEDGTWTKTEVGTPQGAVISPLLANVYLHYVFDLWVQRWRRRSATGDMIVVRYADDIVLGFEHRADAERFLEEWRDRMRSFGLELHPNKTRLIEFGRHAAEQRKRRGEGKPETFDFLGFTHLCGTTRKTGRFIVKRQTIRQRLIAKLQALKSELRHRWHVPVVQLGPWLRSVVQGWLNYHAVPGNMDRLNAFRSQVLRLWFRALRRRGQRRPLTWARFLVLVRRWIPSAKILHPHPNVRFDAKHPRWEPYAAILPVRFCAGGGG